MVRSTPGFKSLPIIISALGGKKPASLAMKSSARDSNQLNSNKFRVEGFMFAGKYCFLLKKNGQILRQGHYIFEGY